MTGIAPLALVVPGSSCSSAGEYWARRPLHGTGGRRRCSVQYREGRAEENSISTEHLSGDRYDECWDDESGGGPR